MNKESVTDVLLIVSRMKHTLFWIALMLSWSACAINSSTCLMPYQQVATARLRDFINQSDAVGVADFADKCLALFDH